MVSPFSSKLFMASSVLLVFFHFVVVRRVVCDGVTIFLQAFHGLLCSFDLFNLTLHVQGVEMEHYCRRAYCNQLKSPEPHVGYFSKVVVAHVLTTNFLYRPLYN